MSEPTVWTPALMRELHELLRRGLSFSQCGKAMGHPRSAIAGAMFRERGRNGLPIKHRETPQSRAATAPNAWDESRLTETWIARKRRRQREMDARNGRAANPAADGAAP